MRRSILQVNQRQQSLMDRLQQEGTVYVSGLCKEFAVSEITIRRDLEALGRAGMLERFHGGARLVGEPAGPVLRYDEKGKKNLAEKLAVAQRAAELVQEDDMLFMNSGSTVTHIPGFLADKRVTILTNNAKMTTKDYGESISLLLTGGAHNKQTQSLTGELAKHALEQVNASVCILGVNGITAADGITTSVYQEAEINATMLARCRGRRIVVADSSKVGRSFNFISAPIRMIDILVTTTRADEAELEKLRAHGVQVITTPCDPLEGM